MNEIENVINERFLLQKEYLGTEKSVNKILPLVSVTVATYQHLNYIKECLDGILMQKVNFAYEVIIGEDDSTDGTQEICKEYAEKYPDKIRLFIRNRKISQYYNSNGEFVARFNGIWNRMSARGKYIAMCEGDDYWTDPLKLQKQVDFLEANPEYSLCCHRYKIYDEEKKTWSVDSGSSLFKNGIDGIDVNNKLNLTQHWLTKTMTVIYRRNAIDMSLLSKYKTTCDTHLFYHILKFGKGYCMNYDAAVYRRHAGGVHSKIGHMRQIMHSCDIFTDLCLCNPNDEILIIAKINNDISMICIRLLFNKEYSVALVKDIISLIKMEFRNNKLKKIVVTLSKIIVFFILSLFSNNLLCRIGKWSFAPNLLQKRT
jgi:glycosyltransferase involved in cell wall biosynthesis